MVVVSVDVVADVVDSVDVVVKVVIPTIVDVVIVSVAVVNARLKFVVAETVTVAFVKGMIAELVSRFSAVLDLVKNITNATIAAIRRRAINGVINAHKKQRFHRQLRKDL